MIHRLLMLGAGGHARVLREIILLDQRYHFEGVVVRSDDRDEASAAGFTVLGEDHDLVRCREQGIAHAVIGVGVVGRSLALRQRLSRMLSDTGFAQPTFLHRQAIVSPGATLGDGVQIMAGAVVQTGARLGHHAVINTRASIDHDCYLCEHTFVGPGAVLCGNVTLQQAVFVGAGAVILPGITIGEGSVVGAGAVVTREVAPRSLAIGSPARVRLVDA